MSQEILGEEENSHLKQTTECKIRKDWRRESHKMMTLEFLRENKRQWERENRDSVERKRKGEGQQERSEIKRETE